jgi:hypothetical protein
MLVKNRLFGVFSIAAIAASFLLLDSPVSEGQGSPATRDVNVVNTPNVNVVNTPTVNVGNVPSVSVTSLPNVTIGNSSTDPVFTRDVNNPVQQAVTFHEEVVLASGAAGGSAPAYTPPAGKRLVIESIAGAVFLQTGQKALVSVSTTAPSGAFFHVLTTTPQGNFTGIFARPEVFSITEHLRLYSDAGQAVIIELTRTTSVGDALLQLTFSGHLVDR